MKKKTPPAKESESYRAYKRAAFWQILLPIGLILLIFVSVSVLVSLRPAETLGQWASISAIWLIIPLLIFLLVNLLLLAGMVYGMAKLLDITPIYTHKLTGYIYLAGEKIAAFADGLADPVVKAGGLSASLRKVFRKE